MKKYELLDIVYKSNLPSRAKQIMFYFINRANAEGICFPSMRTIASDCGISERTIQRTMKILLEEGFVIKENRYRDNGGQSSNLYKLKIEPENNIDNESKSNKESKCDKEIIKEEKLELDEEKNDDIESIEIITFDDYIGTKDIKESSLKREKQPKFNILVTKIAKKSTSIIVPKCDSIFGQYKTRKMNICTEETPSMFLCHGVGDKLYPP